MEVLTELSSLDLLGFAVLVGVWALVTGLVVGINAPRFVGTNRPGHDMSAYLLAMGKNYLAAATVAIAAVLSTILVVGIIFGLMALAIQAVPVPWVIAVSAAIWFAGIGIAVAKWAPRG